MSAKLSDKRVIAGLAGLVLVIVVAAWLAVVGPERKKVGTLDRQIGSTQQQIDEREAALHSPKAAIHVKASDVYLLTRAMPDDTDMSGIVLAFNRLALQHKVELTSIQPGALVAQAGFNTQPVTLILTGQFARVTSYISDLRRLVNVRGHDLAAQGRLFSVDSVDFEPGDAKSTNGDVKATLTVDAFTFAGGTSATPTPTTAATAPSGTVAAGANP